MKPRLSAFILVLFASLIAACSTTETALQTTTPAPSETPAAGSTETATASATASATATSTAPPTQTPTATLTPSPEPSPTPEPTPTVTPIPVDTETLEILSDTVVPINDPVELAQRLRDVGELPPLEPPAVPLEVGAKDTFWVSDYTDKSYEIEATLHAVTGNAYLWIDDNAAFSPADVGKLASTFSRIYATNHEFFGREWSPGIDGDPHIYILFARRLGVYVGGYFSSADEMHPLVHEYSNGHEMFVLNIDNLSIADEFTYGTLAHELQHMIHWNLDRNETTWLNEGFSELAQLLNHYPIGGNDREYLGAPDLQLNTWSSEPGENSLHYGASFLFVTYLLERLGKEATQRLAAHSSNGLVSIDLVMEDLGDTDPQTGELLTSDDMVLDWAIANLIQDKSVGDGRFAYQSYLPPRRARQTEIIRKCDAGRQEFDVHQYGVDYIRILCPGQYTLRFEGAVETKLVPADPYSGSYAFWSNKGDSSDMTLTQTFDLTEHSGPLTLTYWTWYDLERGYDYVYLEASVDGEDWEILTTPSGTDQDQSGNSYGWGYTGATRGSEWIQESVDISQFAGQEVEIGFEYVTDASLHGEGMLIDDIKIPEIGYFSDLEDDDGGWEANGFVRTKNVLPQTFRLALITTTGDATTVETIPLGVNNIVDIPLDIPEEGKSVVLVVVGTTRFTRELATYSLDFAPR